MKRIFLYMAGLLIALAGCKKNTLDLQPFDVLNPASAFRTADDLQLYANSFYKIFPDASTVIRGDYMSDITASKSAPTYLVPGGFGATMATGWSWSNLRNINYFLQHYQQANVSASVSNHFQGLARFF